MRIKFYCLLVYTKEIYLLVDKRGNSISSLYPIPPCIIVEPLYYVSLVLNIYTFYRRLLDAQVALELIKYQNFSYWLPSNISIEGKHMVEDRNSLSVYHIYFHQNTFRFIFYDLQVDKLSRIHHMA